MNFTPLFIVSYVISCEEMTEDIWIVLYVIQLPTLIIFKLSNFLAQKAFLYHRLITGCCVLVLNERT